MRYTRLEMRFGRLGGSQGVLYSGAVAGKVRCVFIDPETHAVAYTLIPRSRRGPAGADPSRRVSAGGGAIPAGLAKIVPGTRLAMSTSTGTSTVGRITAIWADRVTSAVTHVLLRPRGTPLAHRPERVVPFEWIASVGNGKVAASPSAPPPDQWPIYRADEAITRDIRLALAEALPDLGARRAIKVRVEDGDVSLVGDVETREVVEAARRAVARVGGVRGTIIDLTAAETLGERVEERIAQLIREQHLEIARVHVLAEHGIVYLEGSAPTPEARTAIERAALGAAGARVVVNDIAVGGEPPSRASGPGPLVRNR